MPFPSTTNTALQAGHEMAAPVVRAFHRYANWLVSISWKRFFVLGVLLIVMAGILQGLPPFSWRFTETVNASAPDAGSPAATAKAPKAPKPPTAPTAPNPVPEAVPPLAQAPQVPAAVATPPTPPTPPVASVAPPASPSSPTASAAAARAASPASDSALGGAPGAVPEGQISIKIGGAEAVRIDLPAGATTDDIKEALGDIKAAVREAVEEKRAMAQEKRDEAQAERSAQAEPDAAPREGRRQVRTRVLSWGEQLPELAFFWVLASALVKVTYKGRLQAEVKAAQATETAEAESLKRQVVEARMAAMQAQVEPHFLFNTLASIDHLIETDPARASQMQKNLIALLRASMPTMREANASGVRDLARELAVTKPYLEILKVRMEERLQPRIDVPDGLLSAEFPPMMLQSLVENAIKHGLEPKPEGGSLHIQAEIVHGKLALSVTDSGLGFGRAATAGTGVGLANIRERLLLLYGNRASLSVTDNPGGGTRATITVPYKSLEGDRA